METGTLNKQLIIDQVLLDKIFSECCRTYPYEACGFVLGKSGDTRRAFEVVCAQNMQNSVHAKDPARYPRDAKIAYTIDPKEMGAITAEAALKKLVILSIFHSHPEHGVYFSAEDKGMAAPWGEPLFPELSYLVVSVMARKVKNASEFVWHAAKKDFVEYKIL